MIKRSFLLTVACLFLAHGAVQAQPPAKPAPLPPEPESLACKEARERATKLLAELDPKIGAAVRALVAEEGDAAEDWDRAAGIAYLAGGPVVSLWAELNALNRSWQAEYLGDAGIFLVALGGIADARFFLNCALAMGSRSPFVFEALALAYDAAGDKAQAVRAIRAAQAIAPEDAAIEAEVSLLETGKKPPDPRKQDLLERALRELERHYAAVAAAIREHEALYLRMYDVMGEPYEKADSAQERFRRRSAEYGERLESFRPLLAEARLSPAEVKRRVPGLNDAAARQVLAATRNGLLVAFVDAYFVATKDLLSLGRSIPQQAPWEPLFWAEVLSLDLMTYAREIRDARDKQEHWFVVHLSGFHANAQSLQSPAILAAGAGTQDARRKRTQGHDECARRFPRGSDVPQERACRLQVDVEWCEALYPLYEQWKAGALGRYEKAARSFDRAADRLLAWGSDQVLDAERYARRWLKEVKGRPEEIPPMIEAINVEYAALIAMAAGDGEERGGPARMLRDSIEWYRSDREEAEQELAAGAAAIRESCRPIEQARLEALAEEHAKALRELLRDRLIKDFNAKYDPTSSCNVGLGKNISLTFYDDGRVSGSAKLGQWKKAFGSSGDSVGLGGNVKLSRTPGKSVGGSFGASGSGTYGPFNGKADLNVGVDYGTTSGEWSGYVHGKLTPGIGFKTKGGWGASCSPGEFSFKFDPRVVMEDAAAYAKALSSS
jgi:hypothetical protein